MNRNESSRAGATGSHSGYSRSYRAQFSVLGPLHSGFGFSPERIKEHALSVAQKRNQDAELNRKKIAKVPLHADRPTAPTSTLPSRFDGLQTPQTLASTSAALHAVGPSKPLPVVNLTNHARNPFQRLSLARKKNIADKHQASEPSTQSDRNLVTKLKLLPDVASMTARVTMGQKPKRLGVALGVFVDSALCFAALASANLLVQEMAWAVRWQAPVKVWLSEVLTVGTQWAARLPFTVSGLEDSYTARLMQNGLGLQTIHWVLVLALWVFVVFTIQFLCMLWLKSSLGRFLVGIGVNPVASRETGKFSVPLFELLTFGGLFVFPLMLTKPDRHIFLGSLRFHMISRASQVKRALG